jgi:hypothetical protein
MKKETEYARRYREKHREKLNAARRAYYRKNRDKILASNRLSKQRLRRKKNASPRRRMDLLLSLQFVSCIECGQFTTYSRAKEDWQLSPLGYFCDLCKDIE